MTDSDQKRTRRPRRSPATKEQLERLKENKRQLDANKQDRERREESALEKFAEATTAYDAIEQERTSKLEELETQRRQVEQHAQQRRVEVESEQAAALAELNALNRTADDIAALVDLPLKRVRKLIRAGSAKTRQSGSAREPAADAQPQEEIQDRAMSATDATATSV